MNSFSFATLVKVNNCKHPVLLLQRLEAKIVICCEEDGVYSVNTKTDSFDFTSHSLRVCFNFPVIARFNFVPFSAEKKIVIYCEEDGVYSI